MIRWPGTIEPGTIYNDIISHLDWMPTLAAAAGEPELVAKMKKGYRTAENTWKVHLDGHKLVPYCK